MKKKIKDISGQRFGRLTTISFSKIGKNGSAKWLCLCQCGNYSEVYAFALKTGGTKSCGCLRNELRIKRSYKHGDARQGAVTRLYYIWRGMIKRCANPSDKSYIYYGKKGIKVCKEWQDYSVFKNWALANGYIDGLTIDRIDGTKNYCPKNCRWITKSDHSKKSYLNKKKDLSGKLIRSYS